MAQRSAHPGFADRSIRHGSSCATLSRVRRSFIFVLVASITPALLIHCGARTELDLAMRDAGALDATADGSHDATFDAFPDGADAADAAPDVADALPPIDANFRDVVNDCPTADVTFVYLLSQTNDLLSFNPATLVTKTIGRISCPGAGTATPYSMAVDRKGIAYAVFTDGKLYRVSTANATCVATSYVPGQQGFTTFGMGFVADTNANSERLYVSEASFGAAGGAESKGLAAIDISTFKLNFIGPFSQTVNRSELTGTGAGRLFAFVLPSTGTGSRIDEIDKTNAKNIAQNILKTGNASSAFAFAFWGGDFWLFTSPGGATTITRFRPSDKTETALAVLPQTIVGAGVSTCAPSN